MDELERDPMILRWTKHHGLSIPYRKWWGARGRYEPDFLVELIGGNKELREVKGEHLFRDANTARKLRAGDRFCRERAMIFRVVTKSGVNPELWSPGADIVLEESPAVERPVSIGDSQSNKARDYRVVLVAIAVLIAAALWFLLKTR